MTRFFDTPSGVAVGGVMAFLVVLVVGAWAYMTRNPTVKPVHADDLTNRSQTLASLPPSNLSASSVDPSIPLHPFVSPPSSGTSLPDPFDPGGLGKTAPDTIIHGSNSNQTLAPLHVAPAPITPISNADLGHNERANRTEDSTALHLPDKSSSSGDVATAPRATPSPAPQTPKSTMRIEFAPASESTNTKGASSGSSNTANTDSRARQDDARKAQIEGSYQRAINEYTKALDGAGDEAASIHQQIALCYQHMDDKDSAISQYNAAITGYKALVSAGHDVEAANRGIKACEAGIRACQ